MSLQSYSQSSTWRALLNWQSGLVFDQSRVERGSAFFLSPLGHSDSLAELEATIDVFKNPEEFFKKKMGHPYCLFPARLRQLKKDLGLKVSDVTCTALQTWKQQFAAKKVSVMFASQFVSNPASVMGHTFLKFTNPKQPEYMNIAVGYAATIDENTSAISYVYNGLFGGFTGQFSVFPVHEKYHEYTNMESRSLWEYPLSLNEEEIDFLLDYIWELRTTAHFNYYFATENCSLILMTLLQAVRPDLKLTSNYGPYVAPYTTLLRLKKYNLIEDELFTPSLRARTLAARDALDAQEYASFRKSLEKKNLTATASAKELDALLEYFSYQRESGSGQLPKVLAELENKTLIARAEIKAPSTIVAEKEVSPLKSHRPHKMGLGYTQLKPDFKAVSISASSGIHNSMDNDAGFLPNSSFEFLSASLLYETQRNKLYVDRFTILNIKSAPAYDTLLPVYSWSVLIEQRQDPLQFCPSCTVSSLRPSGGLTYSPAKNLALTALAEADYEYGKHLTIDQRLWLRLNLALTWTYSEKIKLHLREVIAQEMIAPGDLPLQSSHAAIRIYNIFPRLDFAVEGTSYNFSNKQEDFWSLQTQLIHNF